MYALAFIALCTCCAQEERDSFEAHVLGLQAGEGSTAEAKGAGLVDTFRRQYPDTVAYT